MVKGKKDMNNKYYDNPNWFEEMMKEEIEFYEKFPKLAQLTINEISKRLRGEKDGKREKYETIRIKN